MKKWLMKKNSTMKGKHDGTSCSEPTHALPKPKDATTAVVPLASTHQTLVGEWSTAMSKEEWERITKLRCPRKPPAHLGVYYEQSDEGDRLGEIREGKKGDEAVTGTSNLFPVSLDKEWSSMRNRHPNLSGEQTLALLTATDAPPITSPPPNISPPQPHIDLPGSSTVCDEITAEIEAEVEKKAREEAVSRRGRLSELGEGLTDTSERNLEEVPLKIIKYKLSHDNKKDSWESPIAIPASTPRVKIGKKSWTHCGNIQGRKEWSTGKHLKGIGKRATKGRNRKESRRKFSD